MKSPGGGSQDRALDSRRRPTVPRGRVSGGTRRRGGRRMLGDLRRFRWLATPPSMPPPCMSLIPGRADQIFEAAPAGLLHVLLQASRHGGGGAFKRFFPCLGFDPALVRSFCREREEARPLSVDVLGRM